MRVIPDNAAKSIESVMVLDRDLTEQWKQAMQRAISERDIVQQALLGRMRHTMSEIDRHVRNARRNEYEE